jgi:16S rRNA processing protein RimM
MGDLFPFPSDILPFRPPGMNVRWDEMAVVGRVARVHGLRGQVIVDVDTDFPEQRFHPGAELFVERNGEVERLTLASVRFQGERPVIGIEGIATIDDAEALKGRELRVPLDRLTKLPANTFYRHDLVGCLVETVDGRRVGEVESVEGTMGGSRLVVEGPDGQVLIPLATDICRTIDTVEKRIVVEPPDGLLELNRRGGR